MALAPLLLIRPAYACWSFVLCPVSQAVNLSGRAVGLAVAALATGAAASCGCAYGVRDSRGALNVSGVKSPAR